MATAFYYPEGPLGPICDFVTDDVVKPRVIIEEGDDRVITYGPVDWSVMEDLTDDGVPAILQRRCRQRTLSDGTIEYYDCVDDLIADPGPPANYPLLEPIYNWPVKSTEPWGHDDNFEVPDLGPDACNPHDPDINIIPVRFYNANGTFVEKVQIEKSTPVTFPVNSGGASLSDGSISASFVESGGQVLLRAQGSGSGNVGLSFEWDDDPNAHGTATSAVSVGGVTFNQSGSNGSRSATISVTGGTDYPVGIVGGTGYGGYSVTPNEICFRDLHENDCNASLTIQSSSASETISNEEGYWSDEGNTYAVWVNPEVCTLPFEPQSVTYFIDIPATDTYTITGGCDDTFNVFLNDSEVPVIGGVGGIFDGGLYSTPYSATTTLQAGTLKMVVQCTNSAAGFANGDEPYGLAYSWDRNPGGWYVKICRGDTCISGNNIPWVKSGPVPGGWGDLMNNYGVYPSNTDPLEGVDHSTTYNVEVPFPGNYIFEYAADNTGTFTLDGTQIATTTTFASSNTVTIPNLTAGPHTIGVTVNNNAADGDTWTGNPAGIAWTLTPDPSASSVTVSFDSNGNIVTTGEGTVEVEFLFEWDDNPNTAGQALGTVTWANVSNLEFTQTQGVSSGSDDDTVVLNGNTTYNIQVFNSTGGFEVQNNGQRICFFDNDGNDCNAQVDIGTITQGATSPAIIASSLDLVTGDDGNLIWHTRLATGYKYVEI